MGSKGSKPRKPSHSQHLPKVGTSTENDRLLHEERRAVLDTMGVGNSPAWLKYTVIIIGVLLLASALFTLAFWFV